MRPKHGGPRLQMLLLVQSDSECILYYMKEDADQAHYSAITQNFHHEYYHGVYIRRNIIRSIVSQEEYCQSGVYVRRSSVRSQSESWQNLMQTYVGNASTPLHLCHGVEVSYSYQRSMNVCVGQKAISSEDHDILRESAFDALVMGARKLHLFERGPFLRTLHCRWKRSLGSYTSGLY